MLIFVIWIEFLTRTRGFVNCQFRDTKTASDNLA
jgi:hypothetical protein